MKTNPRLETVPAASRSTGGERQGLVVRKDLGTYRVISQGEPVVCRLSNRLRKELVYPEADPSSIGRRAVVDVREPGVRDPVAIGDQVVFTPADPGTGVIQQVLPRRSSLSRKVAGRQHREQVIAANVDQVMPVFAAARPRPSWNLLDRYLASAEAAQFPVVIVVNKVDLVEKESLQKEMELYEGIGYPVILTSVRTGLGLERFARALQGKLTVFLGKSGVGKSSLLNAIQPELDLKVSEVGASSGKGRHTTTYLEMHALPAGGGVVDTPGMREFGFLEPLDDPARLFPEMRPYLGRCRFGGSCTHSHEPGCTIKEAVKAGDIDERRYRSFLKLECPRAQGGRR